MIYNYSVSVEYSPAFELVISFYAFTYQHNLKNNFLGQDWYEATKQALPQAFADELADERWEVLHRVVLLISQCPQKETVQEFLQWFEQVPAGELYERLSPWVHSIPLNLGEIRDRSHYLLSMWNEHYFQQLDPSILTSLTDEAKQMQSRSLELSSIDLIEEATNGIRIEPTENLQQVLLIPQYHCAPSTILDFYRGMSTCLFPIRQNTATEEAAFLNLLLMSQMLADEKRLRILLHLSKGSCTLTEIQQHVKLAKSTVHHHISSLRRAGMVRSHYLDHTTPAYYTLRESFLDGFSEKLHSLLGTRRVPS